MVKTLHRREGGGKKSVHIRHDLLDVLPLVWLRIKDAVGHCGVVGSMDQ